MADGIVVVDDANNVSRNIDNAVVTNDAGETVYRQKVETYPAPGYDVAYATKSVASGAWTEVVSHTPSGNDILVVGVGCDMASLLTATYRFRVKVGGDVKFQEVVTTTANSWVPIKIKVPDGTAVAVEHRHEEASAQDTSATINYLPV